MDEEDRKLLARMLGEAEAIGDDGLKDAETPLRDRDEPLGRLDAREKRIYTLILRKLEEMDGLAKRSSTLAASGQVDERVKKEILDSFMVLTGEHALLNMHLGDLLHERLGIPADRGIAIRKGWLVIEVPMLNRPQPTVIRVDEPEDAPQEDPSDDPYKWN